MKTPKPRKLPSGNWNIEIQIGGKRKSITAATRKECLNKAALLKAEYANGIVTASVPAITLNKAINNYIDSRSNVLSPSTINGYRVIQRTRFSSVMERKISEIRNWQTLVNNESRLVSAKTLKNAWGFIHSVLKENRVDPGPVSLPQVISEEQPFLDPDQITVFLNAAEGDFYERTFLFALHGLRRSEVFGLRRKDIYDDVIHLNGAVVRGPEGRFVEKATNKNTTSRRNVPVLIPRLLDLLPDDPEKPVVSKSPQGITNHLVAICQNNGLPVVGLHGLRHSFASLCYHLGLSEEMTMKLGGWSDPAVMRRIYTHLAKKDKEAAAAKLKDFFKKSE